MGKWTFPKPEFQKDVSMFRRFTNVIAGTGAAFAALHVFIGYMGFDKTVNETTGDVPRFLDVPEYQYYLILLGMFLLSLLTAVVLNRIPAAAVLPAAATTTYILLLFDADQLTEGKMTFLLFSIFVLAGNLAAALYVKGNSSKTVLRYLLCLIGLFSAGWAITVYLRAPGAAEALYGTVRPLEELDGIGAVQRYERLEALAKLAEEGLAKKYLQIALAQMITAIVTLFFPKRKLLYVAVALLSLGHLAVLFAWGELPYFPMFFVVPMIVYVIGTVALGISGGASDAPAATQTLPKEAE